MCLYLPVSSTYTCSTLLHHNTTHNRRQKQAGAQTVVSAPRPLEVPKVSLSDLPPRVSPGAAFGSGGGGGGGGLPLTLASPAEEEDHDYTQESPAGGDGAAGNGIGIISEDASDLLNSMFDEDDVAASYDIGTSSSSGNMFAQGMSEDGGDAAGEEAHYGMYKSRSTPDMKSSMSTALLANMAEEEEEEQPQKPTAAAPAPAPVSVAKTSDEERIERLNAQRELERKQREELKPVSDIDKSRKYLLFGEDDDDDFEDDML
jgi:hypothetical protein